MNQTKEDRGGTFVTHDEAPEVLKPRIVVSPVRDQPVGERAGTARTEMIDPDRFKGDFGELDLRRGGRVQVNSERWNRA